MSEENINRTLFTTRVQLDESIIARRATEQVLNDRLLELGRFQVRVSVLESQLLTLKTEYANVVESSSEKLKNAEESFALSKSELEKEIVILKDRISELQNLMADMPDSPAESILESVLFGTMAYLHTTVVYFAALTLNVNGQNRAGKEMWRIAPAQVTKVPTRLFALSVKEKQVVRENIRAFVLAELDNSEYTNIRAVISAMSASDKSWKTFRDNLKNSKVLFSLASDNIEFDSAVNAVVEFILEQLK